MGQDAREALAAWIQEPEDRQRSVGPLGGEAPCRPAPGGEDVDEPDSASRTTSRRAGRIQGNTVQVFAVQLQPLLCR